MVILRTRNKITDFFMILAWASPFKSLNCQILAQSSFQLGQRNRNVVGPICLEFGRQCTELEKVFCP